MRVFIQASHRKHGSAFHLLRQETSLFRQIYAFLGFQPFMRFESMQLDPQKKIRHIVHACFHNDACKLYAHSHRHVYVFDTRFSGWPIVSELHIGGSLLHKIAAHPRLPLVAVCDVFESLYLLHSLDRPNGHELKMLSRLNLDRDTYDGSIGCLDFHATRPLLALGTKQRVVLVEIANNKCRIRHNLLVAGFVHKVQFYQARLLIADHQGCVALYDLETGLLRYLPYTGNPTSILVSASANLETIYVSSGVGVCMLEKKSDDDRYHPSRELEKGHLQKGVTVHAHLPMIVENISSKNDTAILVTIQQQKSVALQRRVGFPSDSSFGTLLLHPQLPLVLIIRPFGMVVFTVPLRP